VIKRIGSDEPINDVTLGVLRAAQAAGYKYARIHESKNYGVGYPLSMYCRYTPYINVLKATWGGTHICTSQAEDEFVLDGSSRFPETQVANDYQIGFYDLTETD
jgi:hypothetical protein